MYYKPDKGFKMKELSESQASEVMDHLISSMQFGLLSLVGVGAGIFLLFKHRWIYALAVWVIANISSGISYYYREKAKEVADE